MLQWRLSPSHHIERHLPLHQTSHLTDLTPVLLFPKGECQRFLRDYLWELGMTAFYISSHFRKPRGICLSENCCKRDCCYKPFPDLDQKSWEVSRRWCGTCSWGVPPGGGALAGTPTAQPGLPQGAAQQPPAQPGTAQGCREALPALFWGNGFAAWNFCSFFSFFKKTTYLNGKVKPEDKQLPPRPPFFSLCSSFSSVIIFTAWNKFTLDSWESTSSSIKKAIMAEDQKSKRFNLGHASAVRKPSALLTRVSNNLQRFLSSQQKCLIGPHRKFVPK